MKILRINGKLYAVEDNPKHRYIIIDTGTSGEDLRFTPAELRRLGLYVYSLRSSPGTRYIVSRTAMSRSHVARLDRVDAVRP